MNPAAKMIRDKFERSYGEARKVMTQEMQEAVVNSMIFSDIMGQDDEVDFSRVKEVARQTQEEVFVHYGWWDA